MAFIDRAGMFAPNTQQFAGLGSGIGAGVNQLAKNRLYDQMKNRYLQGANERAQMQALSSMNLQQAPEEGTQDYAIFQQMMNSKMAQPNMQGEVGRAAMALDPAKGLQYMLQEQQATAKSSKDKAVAEDKLNSPLGQAAKSKYNVAFDKYKQAATNLLMNPLDPARVQADSDAANEFRRAELDFIETVGLKPSEMGLRSGSQIEKNREVTGQLRDQGVTTNNKIEDAIQKAYKLVREDSDIQKRMPSINKTVQKAQDTLAAYADIKNYIDNFEAIKDKPNINFGAIKRLAQLIEPGLQVTTDEVRGFEGGGRISDLLKGGKRLKDAGISLFSEANLMEAAYAAGEPNPEGLWSALVQATNIAYDSMEIYQAAVDSAKEKAEKVAGNSLNAFVRQNRVIPEDRKPQVVETALGQVGFSIPSNITTSGIERLSLTTPMPGAATPPPGGDVVDEDAEIAKGQANAKALAETSTTASGPVNKAAQGVANKATTDILNAFKAGAKQ